MAMDERRRLAYLGAMRVDVWVPRGFAADELGRAEAIALPETLYAETPPFEPPLNAPSLPPLSAPLPGETPHVWVADPEVRPQPLTPGPVGSDLSEGLSSRGPAGMDWDTLEAAVSGCRACALCETRTKTVFGVGNRTADLLIVGEAPGADEDRAGEPFVGRAGQLLNRMLAAIGVAREQVYIANVLKCRPPGNRDPRPEEAKQCEAYLMRQIELIGPRLILCVGRVAAQHVLQTDAPLGSLRGRWLELRGDGIPLRVTYHPAYLLRSPDQKAKAWDDLVAVARRLRPGDAQ
jgi:uracil-DNA glycosylase family 4